MLGRDEHQHQFLEEVFPGYDQSYVPILRGYWSDYSGCDWMVILDRDDQLYLLNYCYSPEANSNEPTWCSHPINYTQSIEELVY